MSNDYERLSGAEYDRLYARYLERPSRLLVAPDPAIALDKETRLLDLCAGSGAVVRAAIEMGVDPHNIMAVDESSAMVLHMPAGVRFGIDDVDNVHMYRRLERSGPFNLITCRQAVNYWWNVEIVEAIVGLLAPGGCFVFNTFNTKPADVPQTKQYVHDGAQYAEIAFCVGNEVHHVQAREGVPMHLTTFKWVDPYLFKGDLDTLVEFERIEGWKRIREGTTDTYVARRGGS